jgi:hypothetical protein
MNSRDLVGVALVCVLVTQGLLAQYDDLSAWAQRDKASSDKFVTDLNRCKNAHEVALALRENATRQQKLTSDLIDLVQRHPELRYVPELGLTNEQFRTWTQAHPEADAIRRALPKEVLKISEDMRLHSDTLAIKSESESSIKILAKYRDDPEVILATGELRSALIDIEKRLMSTF